VSATEIALAVSAALCVALTTDVVVHLPGSIVVPKVQLDPPPGTDACSEDHHAALRDSWLRLDQVEASLRHRYAAEPKVWPQVHRQLDAVEQYRNAIQTLFRLCQEREISPPTAAPAARNGCG
jgi:hypothetical protein